MIQVKNNSGIAENFISDSEIDQAVAIFKSFPSQPAQPSGVCYGVDNNHLGYLWFKNKFMTLLENYFETRLNLVFGMYADLDVPFGMHSDIRPVPGQVYASCLIPVSVDHDKNLVDLARTVVYNELDTGGSRPDNPGLKQEYIWQRGQMFWWDTRLYHCSGKFDRFKTKQSIVIHTYI